MSGNEEVFKSIRQRGYIRTNKIAAIIVTAAGVNFFFSARMMESQYIAAEKIGISSMQFGIVELMTTAEMLAGSICFFFRKRVHVPLLFSEQGLMHFILCWL